MIIYTYIIAVIWSGCEFSSVPCCCCCCCCCHHHYLDKECIMVRIFFFEFAILNLVAVVVWSSKLPPWGKWYLMDKQHFEKERRDIGDNLISLTNSLTDRGTWWMDQISVWRTLLLNYPTGNRRAQKWSEDFNVITLKKLSAAMVLRCVVDTINKHKHDNFFYFFILHITFTLFSWRIEIIICKMISVIRIETLRLFQIIISNAIRYTRRSFSYILSPEYEFCTESTFHRWMLIRHKH